MTGLRALVEAVRSARADHDDYEAPAVERTQHALCSYLLSTPDVLAAVEQSADLRTTLARLTADLAAVTAERDMWRSECESISAELDLPPGIRPAEGELRRMLGHNRALLAERDALGRSLDASASTVALLSEQVGRAEKDRDEARGLLRDAMALVGQYENAVESASRMYHNTQEWGSDKEIEAMFQAVYDERGRIAAHLGRSE